jgi:hypothetical protein
MSRPQQPELARSAKTDLDPDHVETGLQGQPKPKAGGATGPVPPENEPGHHPPKEQDKPDLDAFAAKLGTDPKAQGATSARKATRPKAAPAKAASRPAAQKESPAAPPKVEATPAKRTAAAPTAQPDSAPSPRQAAQVSAPQPAPDGEREPRLVGLMLLPLRQVVKRLDQLDRMATERLSGKLRAREGRGPRGR